MSNAITEITTYLDTHGTFGTSLESLAALIQPYMEKVLYVEDGLLHTVTMDQWKAMWVGKNVRKTEEDQHSGLVRYGLFNPPGREVWVSTPAAVDAATGKPTLPVE